MLKSPYFLASLVLASICTPSFDTFDWAKLGPQILPTLIGFSIAAFAVMFAFMDGKTRDSLSIEESPGSVPPILSLFSTVAWALSVQTFTLIFLIFLDAKPLPPLFVKSFISQTNGLLTLIGVTALFYSTLLVIGVLLYLFDTLAQIARGINEAIEEVEETDSNGPAPH